MTVNSLVNADIFGSIFRKGFKLDFYAETLGAQKVITPDYPPVLILDPNGATQDVLLPVEADSEGMVFFVVNDGAGTEILVVKEDSDTTTIITVTFPEVGIVYCDGTAWRGLVGTNT